VPCPGYVNRLARHAPCSPPFLPLFSPPLPGTHGMYTPPSASYREKCVYTPSPPCMMHWVCIHCSFRGGEGWGGYLNTSPPVRYKIRHTHRRCILQGGVCAYQRIPPLRNWLLTPELQWQSRGKYTTQGGRALCRWYHTQT
jgi:hypothetical protein